MSETKILTVTEEIYDAALGDTPWPEVFGSLSRMVGATSGWMAVSDRNTGDMDVLYRAHFTDQDISAYRIYYRHLDLWTNRTAAAAIRESPGAPPKARISGTLVPDAEYVRSEYYADQGRRLGKRYALGTVLPLGSGGLMPIGFHRADGLSPFEPADAKMLDSVLPHFRRAVQLRRRLTPAADAGDIGLAVIDRLPTAVVVVDGDMTVLVANAAAEALAAAGTGFCFTAAKSTRGRAVRMLTAVCNEDHRKLCAEVGATAAAGSAGGGVRLRNQALAPAVVAQIAPLPRQLGDGGGFAGRAPNRALVFLRDLWTAPRPPGAEFLRAVFGFTSTEAEVARALYGGATRSAVAARRGLRESTVKTHIDAIFVKAGVTGLRELERLFATLGPDLAEPRRRPSPQPRSTSPAMTSSSPAVL